MSFGSALARGIAMGVGQGMSSHLDEMERQRFEKKKMDDAMNAFYKQSNYNQGLKNMQAQQESQLNFEEIGNKDVQTLGNMYIAHNMKQYADMPKEYQAQMFQKVAKETKGKDKAFLVNAMAKKGDFSQFQDNPEYKDAFATVHAGTDYQMPDAQSTFQIDTGMPVKKEGEDKQWEVEANERRQSYQSNILSSPVLQGRGISNVDPAVLRNIDTQLKFGDQDPVLVDQTTGQSINRVYDYAAQGLNDNTLTVYDGTLMTAVKAASLQSAQAPIGTSETPAPAPLETTESKAAETRKTQERAKVVSSRSADLSTSFDKAKVLPLVKSVDRATDAVANLSPKAQDDLYSVLRNSDSDLAQGILSFEKSKDPDAKAAALALQKIMSVVNYKLKRDAGTAVSAGEAQRQFAELGATNAFGSLEETLSGLNLLRDSTLTEGKSLFQGQDPDVIKHFMENAPDYKKLYEGDETYGTPEGKSRTAITNEMTTLMDSGKYTPEQVYEYITDVHKDDINKYGIEIPKPKA